MAINEIDPNTGLPADVPPTPPAGAYEQEAGQISQQPEDRRDPMETQSTTHAEMEQLRAQLKAAQAAQAAQAEPAVPLSQQAAVAQPAPAQTPAVTASAPAPAPAPATDANGVDPEMAALFAADAGRGLNFEQRDLTIPRWDLLQTNSPECKDFLPDYVPGARAGMLHNSIDGRLASELLFIPVVYRRRFVAWFKRNDDGSGGGLVNPEVPEDEYLTHEVVPGRIGLRHYRDAEGKVVEIVDTPEWTGLCSTDGVSWVPAALAMPSTKAKSASKIATHTSMVEIATPDGPRTPPVYANVFRLFQAVEGEGANAYFTYAVESRGFLRDPATFARAKKLFAQIGSGEVEVAPPS